MSRPPLWTRAEQGRSRAERRAVERHDRSFAVYWRKLGQGPEAFAPVTTHDISRSGIALVVDAPLKRGDILVVRLPEARGEGGELWLVRVKHAREEPGPRWLLGCSFTKPITEEGLESLLRQGNGPSSVAANEPDSTRKGSQGPGDPFLEGSASERRGAARRGGAVIPVLVCRSHAVDAPVRGLVLGRSAGGLSLSVPRAFTVGSVIKVRVERGRQDAPWVQARVESCRAEGKEWHLGCQFAESVPSHFLMLFG